MKEYAETFYKGQQWKACREIAMKKAGGLCENCLKDGRIKAAVVVHHIIPITPENITNPEITLNLANLQALCTDCHAAIHAKGQPRRWSVDQAGRIAPRS